MNALCMSVCSFVRPKVIIAYSQPALSFAFRLRPLIRVSHYLPLQKQFTSVNTTLYSVRIRLCRSQWPCGLRGRSSAARLLRWWVRIPPGAWMFVCCECCVLSGRGLCDGLITRPEESYRLWRVVFRDQETSKTRRLKPATGL